MTDSAATLIIPVENQVRELDAKLLLACIAAERGYPVVLGSRAYCHFAIASIPAGVYIAKSTRSISNLMFKIIRMLGHDIVCWEEEALVHPPKEIFFGLRLSPVTIKRVSCVFAWGQENAELIREYPHTPKDLPIHITGNPRGDMLREEVRPYFATEVNDLKRKYGDFILINTNFSDVNPFIPGIGLFRPSHRPGARPRFGQAGKGMTLKFAEGLRDHKQAILNHFQAIVPVLLETFPEHSIVIRPHPSEKHDVYNELADKHAQIQVCTEGNILPWLLATKVMIHNGCTTGMEAYCLQVPAISYLPNFNEYYDYDFQGMPTRLSHQCFSRQELLQTLKQVLAGSLGAATGSERQALIDYYLAARQGPLAGERIMDIMDAKGYAERPPPASPLPVFAAGWLYTKVKAWLTKLNMHRPGPNRRAYHDHRFPELSAVELQQRIEKFAAILGRFKQIKVEPHSRHLFRISRTG
ncbi:MAG: surface carbohydrate biosynthesis protein [Gammaproteobacteria bacterium]